MLKVKGVNLWLGPRSYNAVKKKKRVGIPPFICFNCHVIICKSDVVGCIVFTPICVLVTAARL